MVVTTTTILHLNVMVQQAFDDKVNSSFKKPHYNEVVVHRGTMNFVGFWYILIMDPNVQLKKGDHRTVQQRNY